MPYLRSQNKLLAKFVPYILSQTPISCRMCAIPPLTNTNYWPNVCLTSSHKHQLLAKCVTYLISNQQLIAQCLPYLISQKPITCQMCAYLLSQTPISSQMCSIPSLTNSNYLPSVCHNFSHKHQFLGKCVAYFHSNTDYVPIVCHTSSHKHKLIAKYVPYLLSQIPITCKMFAPPPLTNTNYLQIVCHNSSH